MIRSRFLALTAVLIACSTALARWPEDFNPPPWRGSPLTVHAEWEFMTPWDPSGQDVETEYVDCVGDGIHEINDVWTHMEVVGGSYVTYWNVDPNEAGDGRAETGPYVPGRLNFFLQNWIDDYQYKAIWVQITYGGEGVPFIWEVVAPPWNDPIYGDWVETIEYGPGRRIERWLLQPNPDREFVNLEIPINTWVDEVIIDTISSDDEWPAGGVPNDDCQNATWIGEVVEMPYSTKTATHDNNTPCYPTGVQPQSPNIWYVYTPSCTGTATITYDPSSPCGSSFLGTMAVYRGTSCDPLGDLVYCEPDDGPPCVLDVQEGEHYLIEMFGLDPYTEYKGTGSLTIACEPAPPDEYNPWQSLPGVRSSDAQWGDLDNDGDLDLVICGETLAGTLVTRTYENQSGTLVLWQDLEGIKSESGSNLGLGDYDNDGDLDLAMAGLTAASTRIARIYTNDGTGSLSWDTGQVLTGVAGAAVGFGDCDNDGDLDLVIAGHDGTNRVSTLYVNDPPGTLTADPATVLTALSGGSVDWADYDNDGDLDLLLTGHDGTASRTIFYENHPVGTLTDDGSHGVPGVNLSEAAFGDYDNDGDLDLAITGGTGAGTQISSVYRNDGSGGMTDISAGLRGLYRSAVAWGDYDNDGDLDLGLTGYDGGALYTQIYENTGTGFTLDPTFWFQPMCDGSVTFADVDDDADLDFFVTGTYFAITHYAELYQKSGGVANTAPSAPNSLGCGATAGGMRLSWNLGTDAETLNTGLYYCLRVGTSPGAHDVMSGTYATPLMGNIGQAYAKVLDVPAGTYYFSARTIDTGFMASPWAPEATCTFQPLDDVVVCEPQGGVNPNHPPTYWYDVTPDTFGRCDFHVRVYDGDPANYTNVSLPNPSWQFAVHEVGDEVWASWWDPNCTNAIFDTFRFQFDNASVETWGDWTTTIGASPDPYASMVDSSANHTDDPNGYGYLVHAPTGYRVPNTWFFDDAAPYWMWSSALPFWERMDAGPLPDCVWNDLDLDNPYYACTYPMLADYSNRHFFADIWLANNWDGHSNLVTVNLLQGSWGAPGTLLATDSVFVTNPMPSQMYTFDFGVLPSVIVDSQNPSLILEIIYGGPYEFDTHIYWDGQDCPSALKVRCIGDLDGDGDVDLADLAALLSNYGTPGGATFADGDMDNDGDVDLSDLAALLANYGPNCGP